MPGQLTISARADEIGDNEGEIDAKVEGDALEDRVQQPLSAGRAERAHGRRWRWR